MARWKGGGAALFAFLVFSLGAPQAGHGDALDDALKFARSQLRASAVSHAPTAYPFRTDPSGSWETRPASWWTSGFFPGSLWLAYGDTHNPYWRSEAERRQAGLEAQKENTSTHDVGFMILNSFGNGYELTGIDAYRQVVIDAAESLATRFNPVVGCTRSWGSSTSPDFKVIVDNLMNLELLFWAAKHGGNPAWHGMAVSHALKTIEHHVRPDGSTHHVVVYDPATGAVKRKYSHQGMSSGSTWSRGQAWALHGFAIAYREARDPRFLDAARRTADYLIAHLPPDRVPYWDFAASGPSEPRDSSAAAIAASGLLELARIEPDGSRARRYLGTARAILDSLSSSAYLARGTSSRAVLLHGTGSKPHGDVDKGYVFGDYYFVEALLRYRQFPQSGALPAVPAVPQPAPTLRLRLRRRNRTLEALRGRGLPVRVHSDATGLVASTASIRRFTARRVGLARSRAPVTVARKRRQLRKPGWTTVRVKAGRRAARRLRRLRRLRVVLKVRLATLDGRHADERLAVTLRRRTT